MGSITEATHGEALIALEQPLPEIPLEIHLLNGDIRLHSIQPEKIMFNGSEQVNGRLRFTPYKGKMSGVSDEIWVGNAEIMALQERAKPLPADTTLINSHHKTPETAQLEEQFELLVTPHYMQKDKQEKGDWESIRLQRAWLFGRDLKARERLILKNKSQATSIAKFTYYKSGFELDELEGISYLLLVELVNDIKNVSMTFRGFVGTSIKNKLIDYMRVNLPKRNVTLSLNEPISRHTKHTRRGTDEVTEFGDALIDDDQQTSLEDFIEKEERRREIQRVRKALATLEPKERELIDLYYGLENHCAVPEKELAVVYGISEPAIRAWVYRIKFRLEKKLRLVDLRDEEKPEQKALPEKKLLTVQVESHEPDPVTCRNNIIQIARLDREDDPKSLIEFERQNGVSPETLTRMRQFINVLRTSKALNRLLAANDFNEFDRDDNLVLWPYYGLAGHGAKERNQIPAEWSSKPYINIQRFRQLINAVTKLYDSWLKGTIIIPEGFSLE